MMKEIVIDKSIKRKRIVYKLSAELVFDYIVMYFLAWMLPLISIKLIFFPSAYNHNQQFSNTFFALIDIWLLLGLYFMNKLVIVNGKSVEQNRIDINDVLKQGYPEIEFTSGNPNVIRGQKTIGYSRQKTFTIILDDNNIYINILHTYRDTGFSFFHGFTDYLTCTGIARSFKLAQS